MRGDAADQALLWDTEALCDDLLDDEGFLATLGRARGEVFSDEDFDALYPSPRGRPSHPPSVLAALVLAQLFYGVSDREAERRSRLDLSWKAALGLPLDHRGIPHACLAEFRARLLRVGMVEFLHQKFLSVAKAAGVIGHRRAVDSTGIADSVLTQDTVSLIRSALRSCLERFHALDAGAGERARRALVREDYARAGKPQIWQASATERAQLINELFVDAATVVAACAGLRRRRAGGDSRPARHRGRPRPRVRPRRRWRAHPLRGGARAGSSPPSTSTPATGTTPVATATATNCTWPSTPTPTCSPAGRHHRDHP